MATSALAYRAAKSARRYRDRVHDLLKKRDRLHRWIRSNAKDTPAVRRMLRETEW